MIGSRLGYQRQLTKHSHHQLTTHRSLQACSISRSRFFSMASGNSPISPDELQSRQKTLFVRLWPPTKPKTKPWRSRTRCWSELRSEPTFYVTPYRNVLHSARISLNLLPSGIAVPPSLSEGIDSSSATFLNEAAEAAQKLAFDGLFSSLLAGPSSETDEYIDVPVYLGRPSQELNVDTDWLKARIAPETYLPVNVSLPHCLIPSLTLFFVALTAISPYRFFFLFPFFLHTGSSICGICEDE